MKGDEVDKSHRLRMESTTLGVSCSCKCKSLCNIFPWDSLFGVMKNNISLK